MEAMDLSMRYRCLQLLQVRANGIFKLTLATIKVLFMSGLIRSLYGIARTEGELRLLNLNVAFLTTAYLAVLFKT